MAGIESTLKSGLEAVLNRIYQPKVPASDYRELKATYDRLLDAYRSLEKSYDHLNDSWRRHVAELARTRQKLTQVEMELKGLSGPDRAA